jgi:RNA-binding protein YhbY
MSEFILHIEQGIVSNKSAVRQKFSALKDGKYLVKIDRFKKRSLPQNAYYHGVVVPMVKRGLQEAGYNEVRTNEDAHEIMKHLFLKKEMRSEKNDDAIIIACSTTELSTTEFNAFLEQVWQWGAEYLCIQIPQPNEQLVMFQD